MTDRYLAWLAQITARDEAILAFLSIAAVSMSLWFGAALFPVPYAYHIRRTLGAVMVGIYVVLFAVALITLVGPVIASR